VTLNLDKLWTLVCGVRNGIGKIKDDYTPQPQKMGYDDTTIQDKTWERKKDGQKVPSPEIIMVILTCPKFATLSPDQYYYYRANEMRWDEM